MATSHGVRNVNNRRPYFSTTRPTVAQSNVGWWFLCLSRVVNGVHCNKSLGTHHAPRAVDRVWYVLLTDAVLVKPWPTGLLDKQLRERCVVHESDDIRPEMHKNTPGFVAT